MFVLYEHEGSSVGHFPVPSATQAVVFLVLTVVGRPPYTAFSVDDEHAYSVIHTPNISFSVLACPIFRRPRYR